MNRPPAVGCLIEVVETLALTLIIFFVIQTFIAQPYQVQQNSMEQTLEPDEYVLVDKLTPRVDPYKRGDIIVFTPPPDWESEGKPFIKRVIGVPGDTIEIREDGHVYVNDTELDEPYVFTNASGAPDPTTPGIDQTTWTIGPEELFVLGDHRSRSADSRVFGTIRTSDVIGRAWLRYWPFDVFGVLETPRYDGVDAAPEPSPS